MNNIDIIESFGDLKTERFISRPNLLSILGDVLKLAVKKQFGEDINFDIIMNPDNGDIEIWRNFTVVENASLVDGNREIEVYNAGEDFEPGEEFSVEIKIGDLGRRTILFIKQLLKSKIEEFSANLVIEQFSDMIGELYTPTVHLIKRDYTILIDDNGNEIILPKKNQIRGESFRKGETIKGVIESVESVNGRVRIVMTRTSNVFLERILEREIPEILDEIISIRAISRIPGIKSKVIIESNDERVDPVAICVGRGGSRISGITSELNGETIDIISWTENRELLITRSLKPAKIIDIKISGDRATVEVEDIARAIGKAGSNIKLASDITGLDITINRDINSEEDDDVMLTEFSDEIDSWIIDEFIKSGIETAKSVLSLQKETLVRVTDLEEETIEWVIEILAAEFRTESF